ncbi:hypothetical protein [Bradyrhizobium valentinum]|uniref:hypothetical protein n=1 Tax=Bradyrhizobium valentinum TaxID=1518501 RepID=UPI000A73B8D3|nr:hypothetical protein [Bradyrhizobium valentinum]
MLKFYFSCRGLLKRLRNGALGAEMDRIAGYFFSLCYKRASAKLYLSRIARFSHFAAAHCGHLESYSPQIRNPFRFNQAVNRSNRRWMKVRWQVSSTTDGSWGPSATSQKPSNATTPCWNSRPWQHNLNQMASGKPGAAR